MNPFGPTFWISQRDGGQRFLALSGRTEFILVDGAKLAMYGPGDTVGDKYSGWLHPIVLPWRFK